MADQETAQANPQSPQRPEVNERGVPKTVWDNKDQDPNLRKHVGQDPDGKANRFKSDKK